MEPLWSVLLRWKSLSKDLPIRQPDVISGESSMSIGDNWIEEASKDVVAFLVAGSDTTTHFSWIIKTCLYASIDLRSK